jgi:hypothetical protein
VAALGLLGLGLAFWLLLPTAGPGLAWGSIRPSDAGGQVGLGANAALGARTGRQLASTVGQPRPDTGGYQAYGWIEHGEYGLDQDGVQIAFAITSLEGDEAADGDQAGGQKAIEGLGLIWNYPAGLDVSFEIPPGSDGPLALTSSQIATAGLTRVETARLPATFVDRDAGAAGSGGTGAPTVPPEGATHPGTVTFLVEGSNGTFGSSVIDQTFTPAGAGWSVSYRSARAEVSRLAQLSVSLDCPELGIFQLVVADWDSDHVELFHGSVLSILVTQ